MEESNNNFEPRIIAFVCNWCTYAGADLTGTSRIKYATNVEIVRFPCTGRIDFMLLLKAFAGGADGIIVSGCHPNDCHYTSGNFHGFKDENVYTTLENRMKCGVGKCGRCNVGKMYVCKDGPVFSKVQLNDMVPEF